MPTPIGQYYDQAPYTGHAFANTHPDNLRTRALLAGIAAPPVTQCRVLEVGCAMGANILPMAQTLSDSRFLAIDISPAHIDIARETARRAGIHNIELRCQDLLDFGPDQGEFDFIIAHGIYSWVPANVRDKLIELCRRHLSPTGIAYISYNTLPGWRMHQIVRDMMLFHGRSETDPAKLAAKAHEILNFATQPSPSFPHYKEMLASMKEGADSTTDDYLLHEHLEQDNNPVYFHEFADHLARHGLSYIGTATATREVGPNPKLFSPAIQQQIAAMSPDPIVREQYIDFLVGKPFRASLICRSDAPRFAQTQLEAISKLHFGGLLVESPPDAPGATAAFSRSYNNTVKFQHANPGIITAFRHVNSAWPHAVSFETLSEIVMASNAAYQSNRSAVLEALAAQLLLAYETDILEFWSRPTDFLARGKDRPKATPLARLQAGVSPTHVVTNLRHQEIPNQAVIHKMLPLVDGSRTPAELCSELKRLLASSELSVQTPTGPLNVNQDLTYVIDDILRQFERVCLLQS